LFAFLHSAQLEMALIAGRIDSSHHDFDELEKAGTLG
jgi:hypothetical protein